MSPIVYIFFVVIIVIPIAAYLIYWMITSIRRADSGLKLMILGIQITLAGGIVLLGNDRFSDIGYIFVGLGVALSFFGVRKK